MSLTKVTYAMIKGNVANILDFGADATGSTNSSVAIQAAIDSGVDIIYYPQGTYLISTPVTIKSNQTHTGDGATITSSGNIFQPDNNSSNVIIENLIFAGTGKAIYQADSAYYSISYIIRNCKFAKSLAECVYFTPINCVIEENYFGFNLGSVGASHRHLSMAGKPTGSTAANANVIRKNYFTAAVGATESIYLFYGTGNTFSENIWENNSTRAVQINGGGLTQFDGNYIESNTAYHQIYIQANATAIPSPANDIYTNYVITFTNNVVNMLTAGNFAIFGLDANSYHLSIVGNILFTNQSPAYITDTPAGTNAGVIEYRRNKNYNASFTETGLQAWNFSDTGQFQSGLKTDSPYNSTTTSSSNLVVLTNGVVQRSTANIAVHVAGLGTAVSFQGQRRFVDDATVTTFASIVAGGGANQVPVYSDGVDWRIG